MAWIKLENNTPEKVEIIEISTALNIDMDSALGKCCRVWIWFDENTTDGITKSVTKTLLDRYTNITGFCDAMINAGWMSENNGFISLPNYEYHNSENAKNRALNAKRVSKHRKKPECNANCNDNVTENNYNTITESLPKSLSREDKRIEDNSSSNDNDKYPLINSLLPFLSKYTNRSLTNNPTLATACEDTLQKLKAVTGDNFQTVIETQINIGNNPMTIKNSLNPVKDLTVIASRQIIFIADKKELSPAQTTTPLGKWDLDTIEKKMLKEGKITLDERGKPIYPEGVYYGD
ncbi:MAG: hypothetical protein WC748_09850 [Legionellales bacterium]|jgi:hypothetical protein